MQEALRSGQGEFIVKMAPHLRGVVLAHRRWGKTWLAMWFIHAAACGHPKGVFAYVCPRPMMLRWVWERWERWAVPGMDMDWARRCVKYPNGAKVYLHTQDTVDGIAGSQLIGVCVDEDGLMGRDIASVVTPCLGTDGWVVYLGSLAPKKNWLDRRVEQARTNPEWAVGVYPVSGSKVIDPSSLKEAKTMMTTREYALEFGCRRYA